MNLLPLALFSAVACGLASESVVRVFVDPSMKRCFGDPCVTRFPREKYMLVHDIPGAHIWTTEKRGETFAGEYNTFLGRRFVNNVMTHSTGDAQRPGYHDADALKSWCAQTRATTVSPWSASAVQMVSWG
jgi:hypothetical protein